VNRLVVDASVGVKWLLPEACTEAAVRFLQGPHDLLAPDLIFPEIGNVLWKRVSRGELNEAEAMTVLRALDRLPIHVQAAGTLMPPALEIACRINRTVYDSLYLSLAVMDQCRLVTADRRFYNAVKATPLADHVLWVEDHLQE
jgi:predicted nucleic acid-binding protein